MLCYENHPQDGRVKETGGVAQTLDRRMGTGGGNGPLAQTASTNSNGGDAMPSLTVRDLVGQCTRQKDRAATLTTQTPNLECHQGGLIIHCRAESVHGTQAPCLSVECAHVVGRNNGGENCVSIASNIIDRTPGNGGNGKGFKEGVAYTLDTATPQAVMRRYSFVRRLTPVECERLMGFPDNWTRIPWRRRKEEDCPDSPRYRACGNSMCVNVMRWIGERIEEFSQKEVDK